MFEEYSIGIFPPVYSVELLGKEINTILNGSLQSYTQKNKFSKLFGEVVEFIPSSRYLNSGSVTVIGCLNPNKITNLATKDCTMVLFKTPEDYLLLDSFVSKYQGVQMTLKYYATCLETTYATTLSIEKDFNQQPVSNWLELMNKKSLMVLRMSCLKLWDFKIESCINPLTEEIDYMLEFFKNFSVENETYNANLGYFVTSDENGLDTQQIYTLASEKEIEETNGRCLRINYNRKRFMQELSYLTPVENEELTTLDTFSQGLITYNLPKKEPVQLFNLMK